MITGVDQVQMMSWVLEQCAATGNVDKVQA
jgi:hypothetical protein